MPEVTTQERVLHDIDVQPEPAGAMTAHQPRDDERAAPPRTTVVRDLREAAEPPHRTQAFERVIVKHSNEIALLVTALAKAQGEFGDVERTLKAEIESRRTNSKFEYTYETLADVIRATRKPLSDNGLAVMQFPFPSKETLTLRTMLTHSSGQWIYNDMVCTTDGLDPKAVGSGTTYLMRYSRKAILGIAVGSDEEDDDGAAAMQQHRRPAPQAAQRRSEQPQAPVQAKEQEQPKPVAETRPQAAPTGVVSAVETHANGATVVTLDTGFRASTRDEEIVKALKVFQVTKNARVTLLTRPSASGPQYLPVVEEATLAVK